MPEEVLTDESLMPWSVHKGKRMIDVPASYLLFILNDTKRLSNVREYAKENRQALEKEVKEGRGN